jgi:hypothetical protein
MNPVDVPRRPAPRETDLSKPTSDWLISQGFTPYAEVLIPSLARQIDLIGRKDSEIIAIELKQTLSAQVIHQATICDLLTNKRYAAVATQPRSRGIARCTERGIGLLSITGKIVHVLVEPRERFPKTTWIRNSYQKQLHTILDSMTPYGLAGKPCTKGDGPAQMCYDRLIHYQALNPNSTWQQIFDDIPNHYSSPASMRCAMWLVKKTRQHIVL